MLLACKTPSILLGCRRRTPVCAAGSNSPWADPPGKGKSKGKSSSAGQPKNKPASNDKKTNQASSKRDGPKKPKSSSSSGQGFGPNAQVQPAAPTYKITPPLTPQLLDELSGWEPAAAPLWGTFTGHCEGEWLGQYSAYTPWGGDPEPVWADDTGAYLSYAFCRVLEDRQMLPAEAADTLDSSSLSASAAATQQSLQQQQQVEQDRHPSEQSQQEQQQSGDVFDLLVRSTQRSASISSLLGGVTAAAAAAPAAAAAAAAAPTSSSSPESTAAPAAAGDAPAADEELEAIAYNVNGSVVFNGGSYSLGPEAIEVPEPDEEQLADYYDALEATAAGAGGDGDTEASASSDNGSDEPVDPLSVLPFSTVVVEQVLVASGDKRLRLVATLKLRKPPGQELDIEVARLLLYKEFWYGTADSTSRSGSSSAGGGSSRRLQLLPAHRFEVPVTELQRPQPADLAGTWNVFVLAANPAVEENPNTLQDETVVLYSSREERQHWHVPTITSTAAPANTSSSSKRATPAGSNGVSDGLSAEQDTEDSGGSFWLPGGAVVTLRMVANNKAGAVSGSAGDGSGSDHRGLLIGLHMLDGSGSCLLIEREYDAEGRLSEVRQGTAVKGGWSGGRM